MEEFRIMKILQIGAGSMGKRRMRDLSARGGFEIALIDSREDRRSAAVEKFGVSTFDTLDEALKWKPDAMIISAGPLNHRKLIETAMENGLNCFCEASVFGYDCEVVEKVAKEKSLVFAPSVTPYFYPVTEPLRKVISEELGSLFFYSASSTFYVPEWHPGETADEYYALNRATSAAREVLPFNLLFINNVFDCTPTAVSGVVEKRGNLDIDSEDTWCLQMKLSNGATGYINTTMACRQSQNLFMAVGTNGVIEYDLVAGTIRRKLPGIGIDDTLEAGSALPVLETCYANEIYSFADTILGTAVYPFTYRDLAHSIAALAAGEKSAISGIMEKVDLSVLPAELPDQY